MFQPRRLVPRRVLAGASMIALAIAFFIFYRTLRRSMLRPLIVYVYYDGSMTPEDESFRASMGTINGFNAADAARNRPQQTANLEFFLRHGLQSNADYLFVMNSPTPQGVVFPNLPNIFVWGKENKCYDLGSFRQGVEYMAKRHRRYRRYIMINASVRGPFLPLYDRGCWIDHFLDRLTDDVKMVGTTVYCNMHGVSRHVQSMVLAFDEVGYAVGPATLPCPDKITDAVHMGEVPLTGILETNGYKVDALMTSATGDPDRCDSGDMNFRDRYYGMSFHPYELIFIKANRGIDDNALNHYSTWHDNMLGIHKNSCPYYVSGPPLRGTA
ncbi:uncharacterized protein EV422DRAFT_540342 [Fimicolochytrium jonesii]|uniref:uncharacterized protein n=1 Tax=Fimicolochytrium jonesii TaxID=1396493 RepID=UPI0022FDC3B6|nr:uncharacterized protein EV422DRAFT_540342 [Fimicolochytrium jonesii]KAI8817632.1 hypothetical protein EV422DRAFT_540342 [Fimicolochytrium jonesii]